MRRSVVQLFALAAIALVSSAAGCELIAPFDEDLLDQGAGGAPSDAVATSASSASGKTATSTTGAGGGGGDTATSASAGGGSSEACAPGSTVACYGGPSGTDGVGICKGGTKTCDADGMGYGPCVGEVLPLAEDCGAPGDEDCDGVTAVCTGDYVSGALFGDGQDQSTLAVASDPAGDLWIAGALRGTMNMGAFALTASQKTDLYVAKLAPTGNVIWASAFGSGMQDDEARGIASGAAGNALVTGRYRGSIDFGGGGLPQSGGDEVFITKLDPAGNHVWSKGFGDSSDQAGDAVAVDSAGNVIVIGTMAGQIDFGGGPLTSAGSTSVFLVKLGPAGTHLWSKVFGDANTQTASSVAVDSGGNVVVTGEFQGTIDFGGGGLSTAGSHDCFFAKLDPNGNHVWSQRFGGSLSDRGDSVAVGPGDTIGLAGRFKSNMDLGLGTLVNSSGDDVFIGIFDPSGAPLSSNAYGGSGDQIVGGIAFDALGNVVIAGSYKNTIDFGGGALTSAGLDDIYVAKLSKGGSPLWTHSFGDASTQQAFGVAVTPLGDTAIVGMASGSINLGGGSLAGGGGDDALFAVFGP